MDSMADRLIRAYQEDQRCSVYPASKADALGALEQLRAVVAGMGDFDRFPEGPMGVVLYALMRAQADTCPDVGDFHYLCRGTELLFGVARRALEGDIRQDFMPGRPDGPACRTPRRARPGSADRSDGGRRPSSPREGWGQPDLHAPAA